MRHLALDVIRDEHQALAAMLRSMSLLVAQAQRERHAPDFSVLRAMLFYVDEFAQRLHHPKASELLFPRVRQRCPQLAATLDRLDADHARGAAAIRLNSSWHDSPARAAQPPRPDPGRRPGPAHASAHRPCAQAAAAGGGPADD